MGRRGENIRKRKDGRWEARVIYTHDLSGKAKYRSFYGRTYLEAKKRRMNLYRIILTLIMYQMEEIKLNLKSH